MNCAFVRTISILAAWAFGMSLAAAQQAVAPAPAAQPPDLSRSDLTPAALQQAAALIEKYVQPVAEPEPTPQQKQSIESAMKLLKSEQALKGEAAIARFLQIGPAAIGDLRRLAANAPAGNPTGGNSSADAYAATMATIIINRIVTAQRQPILQELISLGDEAQAVLALKLNENEDAAAAAGARVQAATEALVKAAAGTALDAPAVAGERTALAEAQAVQTQVQARRVMLLELRRLMAPKLPPAQPAASPEEQPSPAIPPADVLNIQPIEPPMAGSPYWDQSLGVGPFSDDTDSGGGGFDTVNIVNVYSQRGAASRWAAHRGDGDGGGRGGWRDHGGSDHGGGGHGDGGRGGGDHDGGDAGGKP